MAIDIDTAPLANTIRMIVENTLRSWDLTDYAAGTVISASPLRVRLHERLILEAKDLVLTTNVMDQQVEVESLCANPQCSNPIPGKIMNGLAVGDKLILIKASRGQNFVVIGKVAG
jgi:hypothetical protein